MNRNFYVNGFSQAGAEHLATLLDMAYPGSNLVGPDSLGEQYQNSMAYIVHTMTQNPDAIFFIVIREPIACLEAAILLTSEGPKRIPTEISTSSLVKSYNTFHWELLDRDRIVLVTLDSILESPNKVLDSLDVYLGDIASSRANLSDYDYLSNMGNVLDGSWERNSIIKSYGLNDKYLDIISKELNSKDYENRIMLLNNLYSLLLKKSTGV